MMPRRPHKEQLGKAVTARKSKMKKEEEDEEQELWQKENAREL